MIVGLNRQCLAVRLLAHASAPIADISLAARKLTLQSSYGHGAVNPLIGYISQNRPSGVANLTEIFKRCITSRRTSWACGDQESCTAMTFASVDSRRRLGQRSAYPWALENGRSACRSSITDVFRR